MKWPPLVVKDHILNGVGGKKEAESSAGRKTMAYPGFLETEASYKKAAVNAKLRTLKE